MRNLITLLCGLVLVSSTGLAATYQCGAAYNDAGSVVLTINANGVGVTGEFGSPEAPEQMISANCLSSGIRTVGAFDYYDTTRSDECQYDYVRIPKKLKETGEGMIALVSRNGGDNHDWSGYQYVYFNCR